MKKKKSFKIKKKISKKGEVMTDSTVNTILLILAFVVILVIIGVIAYKTLVQERSCEDSIVMRSSVNSGLLQLSRVVPLQCTTEKVCLTSSSQGTCPTFGVASKDNDIQKKSVDGNNPDKAKQQVLDEIADDLYQCHHMLGEGQLNFMPQGMTTKNYCLICSRLVLDDKAKQEVSNIKYGELYQLPFYEENF